MQNMDLLPGAGFFSETLTDSREQRNHYFKEMGEKLADCDLVFFDPDNGIEVQSVPKGRRNSSKYVYWDELGATCQAGHSILLYQHFRREERTSFIDRTLTEIQARLNPRRIFWFRTSQVVYFLCAQERHAESIADRVGTVVKHWGGKIQAG
jgi:hypothetical protein